MRASDAPLIVREAASSSLFVREQQVGSWSQFVREQQVESWSLFVRELLGHYSFEGYDFLNCFMLPNHTGLYNCSSRSSNLDSQSVQIQQSGLPEHPCPAIWTPRASRSSNLSSESVQMQQSGLPERPDPFWGLLEASGCSWSLLESHRGFWMLLEGFWRLLEASGGFWRLLETSGRFWRLLEGLLEAPGSSQADLQTYSPNTSGAPAHFTSPRHIPRRLILEDS